MNFWSNNANFPNLLYCRINNDVEYIDAVSELKNIVSVNINYDGEIYQDEFQPFDNETWNKCFLKYSNINMTTLTIDLFKKKPLESEYPILLSFSSNHNYLYWISLSELL